MTVFDRRLLGRRRARAAGVEEPASLFGEVAERLADRLEDVTRRFPLALDLGCRTGVLGRVLGGRGGIETLVQCDLAPAMAARATAPGRPALAADEEALPFAAGRFDLVASVLGLHWVNDLPGALIQVRQSLKPDGLFLAAMLGGETLHELREAFMAAEIEQEGGAAPRVSPFAEVRDAGALLQRAGFALPVADRDTLRPRFDSPLALMATLRSMGESNAVLAQRRGATRRATLLRAAAIYQERFAEADGRVPATFEVIYLTGWAPHESQQQPLAPGSARGRLADALGTVERPAGDKAGPR